MQTNTRMIIAGAAIVAILAALAYFTVQERSASGGAPIPSASSTIATSTATSTAPAATGGMASSSAGYAMTAIPVSGSSAPKAPNYQAPLVFSANVSADEQSAFRQQFSQAQSLIAANAKDFNGWISLGTVREEAGDYQGAAADWEYVSALYPANQVSFANLGDLYANYLHDYAKAAANYKTEIKNDPNFPQMYLALYQLYTGPYPQSSAAIETMLQAGIKANPNAPELQTALSQYQHSQGQ